MNGKVLIAGGHNGLNTIVMVSPNARTTTLAVKLPVGLYGACIVPWNANIFMLIGGYSSNGPRKETYFVDIVNNTVTHGPQLMKARYYFSCEEMIVNGETFIVVVGGHGDSPERSTEMLPKSKVVNGWKKGKIKL